MTQIQKRKRRTRLSAVARAKALQRAGKLTVPPPSPLATGLLQTFVSSLRGKSLGAALLDGLGAAAEVSNTVICGSCGVFALMKHGEHAAGPCANCGADMAQAKRATRADVDQAFERASKPKH